MCHGNEQSISDAVGQGLSLAGCQGRTEGTVGKRGAADCAMAFPPSLLGFFTVALNVVIPISFLDKYYKFFGVNRGKHDDFWGKHRVKQIRSFGSFFDVNCTNCLNATQAVITA